MSGKPLSILILSDGRPGHFRQSEAIAAALARRREVTFEKVALPLRRWIPRALLTRLARLLPPALFLKLAHGMSGSDFPQADLIVSAGAATFGANVALAQLRGVPNVIAGSLRGIDPHRVSLTLLPYRRALDLPNHALLPKPAAIDPDDLPAARPWPGLTQANGYRIGVLLGGPTRDAKFEDADWEKLAALLREIGQSEKLALVVATSPRTPEPAYAALADIAKEPGVEFIDFRTSGPGSAGPVFACDAVLVTLDSMSMITEAVLAQRPVIALVPNTAPRGADAEAIDTFEEQKRLVRMPLETASLQAVDAALSTIEPMTENHLDQLADTIIARVGL